MIARSKTAVQTDCRTESGFFAQNRQDFARVLVSYRTFSQRWAFRPNTTLPGHLPSLVSALAPSVKAVRGQPGDLLANAAKANVRLNVERLKTATPILSKAVEEKNWWWSADAMIWAPGSSISSRPAPSRCARPPAR